MSVVAFDGKTMAADRQGTLGDSPVQVEKIFERAEWRYGCVGNAQDAILFQEWVESGQHERDKPDLEDVCVLAAHPALGLYVMTERLVPVPIHEQKWAIGSGGEFARGAMAAGANAVKAVRIACDLCLSCGLGISVLRDRRKK